MNLSIQVFKYASIITTIPKLGKDPQSPSSNRPISLLNTNIKLFDRVIARRLMPLMPSLIHLNYVGFIPGRQAPDPTRCLLNLIQRCNSRKMLSLLLGEKAFGRVYWGFLKRNYINFEFKDGSILLYSPSTPILGQKY